MAATRINFRQRRTSGARDRCTGCVKRLFGKTPLSTTALISLGTFLIELPLKNHAAFRSYFGKERKAIF
jgi:hypothetical protein